MQSVVQEEIESSSAGCCCWLLRKRKRRRRRNRAEDGMEVWFRNNKVRGMFARSLLNLRSMNSSSSCLPFASLLDLWHDGDCSLAWPDSLSGQMFIAQTRQLIGFGGWGSSPSSLSGNSSFVVFWPLARESVRVDYRSTYLTVVMCRKRLFDGIKYR